MKNKYVKIFLLLFFIFVNISVNAQEEPYLDPAIDDPNCPPEYQQLYYYDNDSDGYGSETNYILSCYDPGAYYVSNGLDCDDSNPNINIINWYYDADGDGFGNPEYYTYACTKPAGFVSNGNDCNDSDANINPDAKWYLDTNNDGVISELDSSMPITQCNPPTGNYINKTDLNYHWIHNVTFDLIGNITSASRTFFNDLGKPNVTLSKDYLKNIVWGTEQLYDNFNRVNRATFIAPSPNTNFTKVNFFNSANLTNYYSDSNVLEPYQDIAAQPYIQTNYDLLNPGNIINTVGGNKINDEWKTGYSYKVPAAQEMYYVYGSDYYDGAITSGKEEVITKFFKSVAVDANGIENVAFTDGEGKTLAIAKSGGPNSYPVVSLIGTQGFVDVHIPSGIATSQISLIGSSFQYKIYNLKTGLLVSTALEGGNAYRIEAITPPTIDPLTYIVGGVPTYDSGSLGINYYVNYYDYAVNVYNKTGQLIKSVQPNGFILNNPIVAQPIYMSASASNFISTYTYNDQGQLKQVVSPDEGTSKFLYRQDGQIRYSQSALQADTKVSYTNYDSYARPIESGVITNNWAAASTNPDGVLISGTASEQTITIYDHEDNNQSTVTIPANLSLANLLTTAGMNSYAVYTQNNLSGNVAITFTKPGANITAISWYSYDLYGRTQWVAQYNEGIGLKTVHYYYDYKGNVNNVIFQKDKALERFEHRYSYDSNGVLTKVETGTNGINYQTDADYSYYLTGELKRVNIAQGAQGLDYVYTLGGQLKSINHPSLEATKDPGGDANDVFGITLDYYSGDYLRTGRNITSSPTAGADYNGNIKAARWTNKGIAADYTGGIANQKGYLYNYDRNNWLTGATFGNTNASTAAITPTANYNESGLSFDANGNIKSLKRSDHAGTIVDDLTYNYTNTGKNQLNNLTESAAVTSDPTDIETQSAGNYVYDAIGQITRNVKEDLYYFYNTQGLVTQVNRGANAVVRFFYNERGQRTKKESYNTASPYSLSSTDYYIVDLSGNVMSIYNQPNNGAIVQKDLPIFGLSRLGVYNRASATSAYEIADHLGNVRAVVSKPSGSLMINSFADYYPFGELLPNRNSNSGNYRYAFQGQELDPETGMEAFQLRLWDGRIGRWLSPDPYGEFHSPYLGMGNNPVSTIDPDGGCTKCPNGAKAGDSFNDVGGHGNVTFDGSNWITSSGSIAMNDVVIVGTPKSSSGLSTAGDIALGFVPGSDMIGMYQGARDGNWGQFAMSTAFFAFDVATLGTGSLIKGGLKAAIKVGAKELAEESAEQILKSSIKSARRRAVRQAWKQEKNLVKRIGQGTRDWTESETKELLTNGKVKDFVGHHINNVKHHPELAGNPANIEFVTKAQHLAKHGGNFKNKTIGELINR